DDVRAGHGPAHPERHRAAHRPTHDHRCLDEPVPVLRGHGAQVRKSIMLFIAASGSLLAVACTATGGGSRPTTTPIQPGDVAYCQRLVIQYTTYVGSVGGTLGG